MQFEGVLENLGRSTQEIGRKKVMGEMAIQPIFNSMENGERVIWFYL